MAPADAAAFDEAVRNDGPQRERVVAEPRVEGVGDGGGLSGVVLRDRGLRRNRIAGIHRAFRGDERNVVRNAPVVGPEYGTGKRNRFRTELHRQRSRRPRPQLLDGATTGSRCRSPLYQSHKVKV